MVSSVTAAAAAAWVWPSAKKLSGLIGAPSGSIRSPVKAAPLRSPCPSPYNPTKEGSFMSDRSVLIVDDEKNIRLTLSLALEKLNIPVDTAVNGEEALKKLAEKSYGLMLLDLRMPGIDGMEVLRRVPAIRPEAKVVIITAYG